jgi:glycerol-3-phosphate O-acyltransferase
MAKIIALPLWLVLAGGALTAWALFDRVLVPGFRWLILRREEIFISKINKRLNLRLPAFKLTRRRVLIERLLSDPSVLKAIDEFCQEKKVPLEAARKKAESYAREIVPSFHAYLYFRLGNFLGKSLARILYRVRIGYSDEENLAKVNPQSSVVFLMNHRSNMDYVLLGYLTLSRAAISFAVGEWARVWPIRPLVKATGAYFVRRGSGDTLYRRVLANYVQMAAEGGLAQAIFLEGSLSRDGKLHDPKIGLLDYLLRNFDPEGVRDLVFIPAGINYDRVLEDRTLLLERAPTEKKSGKKAALTTLGFVFHNLWLMMRGGWYRFGYAAVNFGTPISMRTYSKTNKVDYRKQDKASRTTGVTLLAGELLTEVGKVIPVLPVSLVSFVLTKYPDRIFSDSDIKAQVHDLVRELEKNGAHIYIPRRDLNYFIKVGLRMLTLRRLAFEEGNTYRAAPEEIRMLQYYANTISHLLP